MAKLNVDEIKEEAVKTIANYKGLKGNSRPRFPIDVRNLRIYCRKVLFLCKEIKKLQKKLNRTQKGK